MSPRSWSSPAVIVASVGALLPVLWIGGSSPLRSLLVAWFLAICPGLAIVGSIRLADRWLEISLALALSLALDVIIAATMSYAGLWSPGAALGILVAISLAGALAQLASAIRRSAPSESG